MRELTTPARSKSAQLNFNTDSLFKFAQAVSLEHERKRKLIDIRLSLYVCNIKHWSEALHVWVSTHFVENLWTMTWL